MPSLPDSPSTANRLPRERPADVLHILGTARAEGTAMYRIVNALAEGLDAERYRLHAWFLDGHGPLVQRLAEVGIPTRVQNWSRGLRDPAGARFFWQSLCTEKFRIIHQHFGGGSVRWLARHAGGAKLVVHVHGHVIESRGPAPVSIPLRGADAVIAVSHATARQVIGVRPTVVYSGVRSSAHPKSALALTENGGAPIMGAASRLHPIKGLIHLVRAMALLREEFSDLCLEIAGTGPEYTTLENEVRLSGLRDRVRFLGWQAELGPLFARWTLFVQPSLGEGLSLATLEAMAAELPVVASAVGGLSEVVEDGRTGWLVPPANPELLAERIRWLLLNPEERSAMGAAGQIRARTKFSVRRMVHEISEVYDRLLKLGAGLS